MMQPEDIRRVLTTAVGKLDNPKECRDYLKQELADIGNQDMGEGTKPIVNMIAKVLAKL